MADDVLYDLGVDVSSSFDFHDGDLNIASYEDNIVQAVVNRFNTQLDELDLFYEDYGSILTSYLGWRANDTTIALIKVEIDNALKGEPRIANHEVEITYDGNGVLMIDLKLYPVTGGDIDVNLILNGTGVVEVVENAED